MTMTKQYRLTDNGEVILTPRHNGEKIIDYSPFEGALEAIVRYPDAKINDNQKQISVFSIENNFVIENIEYIYKELPEFIDFLREKRGNVFEECNFYIERYNRQLTLGIPTENSITQIESLQSYLQEWAEITETCTDVENFTLPVMPDMSKQVYDVARAKELKWGHPENNIRIKLPQELVLAGQPYADFYITLGLDKAPYTQLKNGTTIILVYLTYINKSDGFSLVDGVIVPNDTRLSVETLEPPTEDDIRIY